MVAVAVIGSAAIGGAASYASSRSASRAASNSAAASQAAADQATAEQRRQYDQSRADQLPWLNTGRGALSVLANQYGIDPATGATGSARTDSFMASPDYQFRQNEQMRALTARNAALGIQDSGAAQRSALAQSGNLASGEYGNWYNRLAGLAGVGQTAANTTGQLGANYAGQVGNIAQNNAANLSSSYQQRSQAQQGLYGGLAGIGTGLLNNLPMGGGGVPGLSASQNYGLRGLW